MYSLRCNSSCSVYWKSPFLLLPLFLQTLPNFPFTLLQIHVQPLFKNKLLLYGYIAYALYSTKYNPMGLHNMTCTFVFKVDYLALDKQLMCLLLRRPLLSLVALLGYMQFFVQDRGIVGFFPYEVWHINWCPSAHAWVVTLVGLYGYSLLQ